MNKIVEIIYIRYINFNKTYGDYIFPEINRHYRGFGYITKKRVIKI